MKKLTFLAFIFIGSATMAQSSFGIKGGLNYGATGEYQSPTEVIDGDNKLGYHLGIFGNFELYGIFLQPELLYTRLNTDYSNGTDFEYQLNKIDLPVLLGVNVLGPLNLKAGPSFQYVLNNKVENGGLEISDVENDITVGYQLGAGLNFGNLGFDVRYEGAFTENTAFSATASENFRIDSRPSQWILSLAYRFN